MSQKRHRRSVLDFAPGGRALEIDMYQSESSDASPNDAQRLLDAVVEGDIGTMAALLQQGIDVNARHPETGETPLHYVAGLVRRQRGSSFQSVV